MQNSASISNTKIQDIIEPLYGQLCWDADLSYGEELNLEFGGRTTILKTPKFTLEKGDWSLGTRDSNWVLSYQDNNIITSEADSKSIRTEVQNLEGKRVNSVIIQNNGGLQVNFNGNYQLTIIPVIDLSEDALFNWELFTPDHKILRIKAKSPSQFTWSYISSQTKV
ncbi:hypothetical protein PN462_19825 [Spirulina sp. CS-785/01]|uniref:hypothetical protein n=1 Tax=Spirulina sp. CS-785/01 TaxID=3021716 RepID=UPI00232B0272|nr:hypothetical protein [Spirulina sp. CS-785/01]MDB9315374.1 hypothetical protein [Spirulina sp. CS-785/01]